MLESRGMYIKIDCRITVIHADKIIAVMAPMGFNSKKFTSTCKLEQ